MSDTPQPAFTSAEYDAYLAQHKLIGSRCRTNGELYVPPRPLCPVDHTAEMELVEMSGRGKLIAYTVIAIAPTAMIEAGYNRANPYCAGVVRLEEGPAVSAQIIGIDVTQPEKITIGMPVQAAFIERGEGDKQRTYLAFEPV